MTCNWERYDSRHHGGEDSEECIREDAERFIRDLDQWCRGDDLEISSLMGYWNGRGCRIEDLPDEFRTVKEDVLEALNEAHVAGKWCNMKCWTCGDASCLYGPEYVEE